MGEVERVHQMLRRGGRACCAVLAYFELARQMGGGLVEAECGASTGWVTCTESRGRKGLTSEAVRILLSRSWSKL
jgi:hypothetical protein